MSLLCYRLRLKSRLAVANFEQLDQLITKGLSNAFLAALISTACLSPAAAQETVYFLVGHPRPSDWELVWDSYVLPLSKQDDIDHARCLIALGRSVFSEPHQTIVGARVGPGKDGINRNYIDPKFPEWSWHIIEFQEFADVSTDVQDGSPTELENDPPGTWVMRGKD